MGACDEFGCDTAPTKEYLLRQEYPDLEEKWLVYNDHKRNFLVAEGRLSKFGIVKRFFNPKEYDRVRENWVKTKFLYMDALKEYQILEKLLWDY
ncbi:hypothetical protein LCGC14_1571130 [marine sediment metagenome]|uniref:Uncharacterized protein n=1 Tax=marine sediment metagenome TaxID=412755 RepID=A0A0F9LK20_9ZZZZ